MEKLQNLYKRIEKARKNKLSNKSLNGLKKQPLQRKNSELQFCIKVEKVLLKGDKLWLERNSFHSFKLVIWKVLEGFPGGRFTSILGIEGPRYRQCFDSLCRVPLKKDFI